MQCTLHVPVVTHAAYKDVEATPVENSQCLQRRKLSFLSKALLPGPHSTSYQHGPQYVQITAMFPGNVSGPRAALYMLYVWLLTLYNGRLLDSEVCMQVNMKCRVNN